MVVLVPVCAVDLVGEDSEGGVEKAVDGRGSEVLNNDDLPSDLPE